MNGTNSYNILAYLCYLHVFLLSCSTLLSSACRSSSNDVIAREVKGHRISPHNEIRFNQPNKYSRLCIVGGAGCDLGYTSFSELAHTHTIILAYCTMVMQNFDHKLS